MTVSNLGICFAPTLMRGPEENALSIMEIKYSNVVANTLIEQYDSIFNDPRLSQPQKSYQSPVQPQICPQPIRYTTSTTHTNNNHDDYFGLGLPNVPYQSHQVPSLNSFPYYPVNTQNTFQYYPVNTDLNSYQYFLFDSDKLPYRSSKVVTLYACVADTESELSFGPNEVVTDVRNSVEKGWLVGTLERTGQRGLLPANYVMFI